METDLQIPRHEASWKRRTHQVGRRLPGGRTAELGRNTACLLWTPAKRSQYLGVVSEYVCSSCPSSEIVRNMYPDMSGATC